MAQQKCIFCRIAQGEIPATKLYQDDHVLAFLDVGPLAPGHTLVIPREHYPCLHDLPADAAAALAHALGPIAQAILAATDAPAYNILNNNGRAAGQLVQHVHFHIIPRRPGDNLFPDWPATQYPPGQAEALAQKIRQNLPKY